MLVFAEYLSTLILVSLNTYRPVYISLNKNNVSIICYINIKIVAFYKNIQKKYQNKKYKTFTLSCLLHMYLILNGQH